MKKTLCVLFSVCIAVVASLLATTWAANNFRGPYVDDDIWPID